MIVPDWQLDHFSHRPEKDSLGRGRATMVMADIVNDRYIIALTANDRHDRHSFHQDFLSRRCGSSHAGFDGRARGAA
jgi:hypothetical protein